MLEHVVIIPNKTTTKSKHIQQCAGHATKSTDPPRLPYLPSTLLRVLVEIGYSTQHRQMRIHNTVLPGSISARNRHYARLLVELGTAKTQTCPLSKHCTNLGCEYLQIYTVLSALLIWMPEAAASLTKILAPFKPWRLLSCDTFHSKLTGTALFRIAKKSHPVTTQAPHQTTAIKPRAMFSPHSVLWPLLARNVERTAQGHLFLPLPTSLPCRTKLPKVPSPHFAGPPALNYPVSPREP